MEETDDSEFISTDFFTEGTSAPAVQPDSLSAMAEQLGNSFSFKQIGSMSRYIEPVSGENSIDMLVELFQSQPELTAVPVEEYDRVIGVIDRKTVAAATNTAWKRFTAKKIGDYVQRVSAVLYARDFIEKSLQKVSEINRKDGILYFPVFNNRSFFGIVSLDDFLSRIAEIREQDLRKAFVIQQRLFPDAETLAQLPFRVQVWNRMANALGGDLAQVIPLSAGSYLVCCFDVSGKNVAASLLTIAAGSFFNVLKYVPSCTQNPLKLVSLLDEYLEYAVPVGSFITAAFCYVDTERQLIQIYNCGHTAVYVFFRDEAVKNRVNIAAVNPALPPLGMGAVKSALNGYAADPAGNVKPYTQLPVKAGMHVDLYSDGLSDMQGDDGVRFDDDRTRRFFMELYCKKDADVSGAVEAVVDGWIHTAMLPDDITVVDIRL
ncbi:PP2C family protein-serine/threonine phosphatase [Treponema brennaborense]|uniref:Protein serine/threonine phosphatase n=1 Tax=Treponema brennaborense (strain DSM 12168 / CIP 105900 / DD5/3) TaxID=906968 RepID=F4LPG7_TREBD|nr:SpoIIE family protein phosphatase [Treponema brennaborense]AEE15978.1 protein serine/threonine phosphatase [Treponema brennaborense DSM 12168]